MKITIKEVLKSLNAWHSEIINGTEFYEAEAVKIALEKISSENKPKTKDKKLLHMPYDSKTHKKRTQSN